MILIRVAIGAIIAAMVFVGLVPMLVLLDLAGGGDGWGLCQGGLSSCRAAYFEGPELVVALAILLFLLFMLLRLAFHLRDLLEARRESGRAGSRLGR